MAEYRVAELAEAGDTSVRNIRVYQDRGILPPPRREGKIALYSDEHLVRLRLTNRLLARGYPLAVIRDLVDAWSQGRDLNDVLGLESVLSRPWSNDEPEPTTLAELQHLLRGQATPELLARAIDAGILAPGGSGFLVLQPRQLAAGSALVAAGVPLVEVMDLTEAMQEDVRRAADRIVDLVSRHLLPSDGPEVLPSHDELPTVVTAIDRLRPHAHEAVSAMFATAMTHAIGRAFAELVERTSKNLTHPATDALDDPNATDA